MDKFLISDWQLKEKRALRDAFGEALVEVAKKEKKVIALTADLETSTRLELFHQTFPERFFQVGVAEQNLIGISAGLAMQGFIPFACSFATFITGRAWEQIKICVAANNLPVKIVGSHAGLSHPSDGFTAQATEDLALMQVLPNIKVVYPADFNQTKILIEKITNCNTPIYLRITREPTEVFIKRNSSFTIGEAQILKEGSTATIVSAGPLLAEILKAAAALEKFKIKLEVINLHTIKPLDEKTIIRSLSKTKKLIVVEDHQLFGGLASSIFSSLKNLNFMYKCMSLGINDQFGATAGTYIELLKKFSLDSNSLIKKIKNFVG